MKKYIILFIFKFIISFANKLPLDLEDNFFDDIYQENIQEKALKNIKISQGRKISNLNPILINDDYSKRFVNLVYNRLFIKDNNGEIKPSLVKEFKWLDEKNLYIELKSDIYFHNGDELEAKDIKFSLEQLKNNNLKYLFSEIMEIKILDDKKLVIKLSEEDNTFLEKLTYDVTSIVKIKGQKIYGTGKYYVKSLKNNSIVLRENKDYFEEVALVEELQFYSDIKDQKRLISLFNERVDAVLDIDEETLEYGEKFKIIDENSVIIEDKTVRISVLSFGQKYRYSRAEKEDLRRVLGKEKTPFFPKELINIDEREKNTKANSSKNISLKKSIDLMILNTDKNIKEAEEIKSYFKRANIELNILPHNFESYSQKMKNKDYDLALYDISIVGNDILFNIAKIFLKDLEEYEVYNSLKPFFKLLKQEKTAKGREIILKKMLGLIQKELPYIPIKNHKDYMIISEKVERYYKEWEKKQI
ncbi:ABC transporter substrate-binding protein [Fusobacterium sp. SYSU M8A802]